MSEKTQEAEVHLPMVRKMERICRGYVERLEQGGDEKNLTKFFAMFIFGSTNNTAYRTRLFDLWPTYLEDFNDCKEIMGYRYPETLVDEFLTLKMDKNVKIIDVACGPGNVANVLKDHGYTNCDGLDPSQGFLDAAMKKNLYKKTYCAYITPDKPTEIADGTYDVLLCSAGMFPGSIVPQAFKELLRLVKSGGYLIWNIAEGYEGFNDFFLSYDKIIKEHVSNGDWEFVQPVKKLENMLFEDGGYTYMMKKLK